MRLVSLMALVATLASTQAMAQDVVVMRRQVATAKINDQRWATSQPVAPRACSATATWTREVWCERVADGAHIDPSACRGPAPSPTVTMEDRSGCSYDWALGTPAYGSTCADQTTKTTPVSCNRFGTGLPAGGELAPSEASCLAVRARPQTTEQVANWSSCAYDWTTTPSTCAAGQRTVQVECRRRAQQGVAGVAVADAFCTGQKPSNAPIADPTCQDKVTNGGFETLAGPNMANWSALETYASYGIKRSGQISAMGDTTRAYITQDLTLQAGTVYTVSLWCLKSAQTSCKVAFGGSGAGRVIASMATGGASTPAQGTWTLVTADFTPTASEASLRALTISASTAGSKFYADDVSVSAK